MFFIQIVFVFSLFVQNGFAQDLKEFQQSIFCIPTKSEIINSLNIVRVQEKEEDSSLSERIKFKLVFSDYLEVIATNLENGQLKITNHNKASVIDVFTTYFPVRFFAPSTIWKNSEHNFNFIGFLEQGRYLMDKKPIELNCTSRLTKL
jgi:hypothetical protein